MQYPTLQVKIKESLFGLLVLTCRVGYCIAAAVDVDLASGASNIYSLIAGSFIIWQGTCMYSIESFFSDLRSPLLSFECVLCSRLLQCEPLCVSLTEVKSLD